MSDHRVLLPFVLAGAVAAVAGVPQAQAQETSFDCLKAAAPIELLICSDPELLTLDSAIEEVLTDQRRKLAEPQRSQLAARQKEWLDQRLERCGVPAKATAKAPAKEAAKEADIGLELRWRAAACLADLYRARLAALGVPPEPAEPSVPEASQPGFIHPNCLWPIVEEDPEATPRVESRIPIDACARGNRHIPVTLGEEGGFAAQAASEGYYTWLSYRIVGRLADGREPAIVWYNAGGTGVFSEIYLLRRTPAPDGRDMLLSGELVGGGGDRCNGGIERAELLDGRTLQVDYRVTPQDLLSEGDEQLANDTIDALAFCAVCCTGTVRRTLDLVSRQEATVSATVDELLSEDASTDAGGDGEPAQACFDLVVRKAAGGTLPHTFRVSDVKALAATFAKQCLKR